MRCSWAENSTGYSIMSAEDSPDSVWSEAADARCNGRPVSSDSSLRPSVTLAHAVGPQLPQEGPPQSTHDRLRTDATIAGDAPSADSSARQTSSNIRFGWYRCESTMPSSPSWPSATTSNPADTTACRTTARKSCGSPTSTTKGRRSSTQLSTFPARPFFLTHPQPPSIWPPPRCGHRRLSAPFAIDRKVDRFGSTTISRIYSRASAPIQAPRRSTPQAIQLRPPASVRPRPPCARLPAGRERELPDRPEHGEHGTAHKPRRGMVVVLICHASDELALA